MLLAFVLVAGLVDQGNPGHKAVAAKPAVIASYDHAFVAEIKPVTKLLADSNSKTYAAVLASVGGTFVVALFASLITTVAFAFKKKNGGKNV